MDMYLSLLEFECHLHLQEDSSNNVCSKWRMKIQTKQKKPHMNQTSIAQEFYSIIHNNNIWCYNSLHRKNSDA